MPLGVNYTYKIPKDASYVTLRNQNRMIYANYRIQQNNTQEGCQGTMRLQDGGVADGDIIPKLLEGARETTAEEIQEVLDSESCPVASSAPAPAPAPAVITNIDVLVIGDGSVGNIATGLQSARTAAGYTQTLTITSVSINNYAASGLDAYDVVFINNNSSYATYSASLGGNLQTFVDNGGHLIMSHFDWGNLTAISNFSYTNYSTYAFGGTFPVSVNATNLVYTVTNPITTGVANTLGSVFTSMNAVSVSLTTGATSITDFTSGGISAMAIKTKGSAKLVGFNFYLAYNPATYPNITKFACNAIYYCMGLI